MPVTGFWAGRPISTAARSIEMIDLNVRVLTDLSLRFTDSLVRHRGGVLNVASIAAFAPGPGMAVYHATKAYVLSFSEALHRELEAARHPRNGAVPRAGADRIHGARRHSATTISRASWRAAPERVAREGYDGFMAGRAVVVPGTDQPRLWRGAASAARPLVRQMARRAARVLGNGNVENGQPVLRVERDPAALGDLNASAMGLDIRAISARSSSCFTRGAGRGTPLFGALGPAALALAARNADPVDAGQRSRIGDVAQMAGGVRLECFRRHEAGDVDGGHELAGVALGAARDWLSPPRRGRRRRR